jgi:hypothetical protein
MDIGHERRGYRAAYPAQRGRGLHIDDGDAYNFTACGGKAANLTAAYVMPAAMRSRALWAASARTPRLLVANPTPSFRAVSKAAAMMAAVAAARFSFSARLWLGL